MKIEGNGIKGKRILSRWVNYGAPTASEFFTQSEQRPVLFYADAVYYVAGSGNGGLSVLKWAVRFMKI